MPDSPFGEHEGHEENKIICYFSYKRKITSRETDKRNIEKISYFFIRFF
jgi:hypothetical protein